MRITIIGRYVFMHFIGPYIVAGLFFTFIIMVFYLKEVIRIAIEKKLSFLLVAELMFYSLGWTISMTLPMAALMAVIMAIGRLNGESELIAMRAGGITYPRIFRPFLIFGILMTVFMMFYSHVVIPFCYTQMATIMKTITRADPVAVITPGQFVTLGQSDKVKQVIYAGNRRETKRREILENIQIRKIAEVKGSSRLTELVIAREAEQIEKPGVDGETIKALRLYRGFIFSSNDTNTSFMRVDFSNGSLDVNLNLQTSLNTELNENEFAAFTMPQLKEAIEKYRGATSEKHRRFHLQARTEYHKRFSLPFATISFLILGFPLGISNRRSGKGMGFGISIVFIFVYFIFYLMADSLASSAKILPPLVAAWSANLVILLTGAWFFWKRTRSY